MKKRVELKVRNRIALQAWRMSGAGRHNDKHYQAKTKACDPEEWKDELDAGLEDYDDINDSDEW